MSRGRCDACNAQRYSTEATSAGGRSISHQVFESNEPLKILRLPQVCEVTGLGRSMIYQMEAEQRSPARAKIGTRAVGWLEREVNAWLTRRVEARRPTETVSD